MKKIFLLFALCCIVMTGCSNEFAQHEYDSDEKISEEEDRYTKVGSIFNPIEGGYSLTVLEFDGRETLWSDKLKENQTIEIDFSLTLTAGKAKVVHVDAEGNVTTLIECSPETVTDGYVTKSVTLKEGRNRLKIVGDGCENLDLKLLFEEP